MTIHIGEKPSNVQTLQVSPIDMAAENAVSGSGPAKPTKMEQLIEAHTAAWDKLEATGDRAFDALAIYKEREAENKYIQITPDGAPKVILDLAVLTPSEVTESIDRHYEQLKKQAGMLPKRSQTALLSEIYASKTEAISRVEEHYSWLKAVSAECGLDVASQKESEASKAERAAFLTFLAARPETKADASSKSRHLRTTSWFADIQEGGVIDFDTVEAMMQGMGCGVAS